MENQTADGTHPEFEVSLLEKEDFFKSQLYEILYDLKVHGKTFDHDCLLESAIARAKEFGVTGVRRLYKEFVKQKSGQALSTIVTGNLSTFEGQPLEIDMGHWEIGDNGCIQIQRGANTIIACPHPIMPVRRLEDADTGEVSLELAYFVGGYWKRVIAKRSQIASQKEVTRLADYDVSVNGSNAKPFMEYIFDVENLNRSLIMVSKSVTHLGYIPGLGFSPYVAGVEYGGKPAFRQMFDFVVQKGSPKVWKDHMAQVMRDSMMARIYIASSFASVLIKPLGVLPFFVHLWGITGGGKTVSLMCAASVWGNPEIGALVKSFDSTQVGLEWTAEFLGHLPFCINELQLNRDNRGRPKFSVYNLTEGQGRLRGNTSGTVEKVPTWRNVILTNGETPMNNPNSGAGAINRVIDIPVPAGVDIIRDGHKTSNLVRENHGFAGREFVSHLYPGRTEADNEPIRRYVSEIYDRHLVEVLKNDTTEKQSQAAAVILTADDLVREWVFSDYGLSPLPEDSISNLLASRSKVSDGERAYDHISGWISMNKYKFDEEYQGERYGVIEGDVAYINSMVLKQAITEAGFSWDAVLSQWRAAERIRVRTRNGKKTKGYTITKRIKGINTNCVAVVMVPDEEPDESDALDIEID